MTTRTPLIFAVVRLLLPVLYVGSYLALVVPSPNTVQHGIGHASSDSDEITYSEWPEYSDAYRIARLTNAFSKKNVENHEAADSGKSGKLRPMSAVMAGVVPDLWNFDRCTKR